MTKGKVSPLVAAILHNREARERLRQSLSSGEDFTIRIGDKVYRVSTSDQTKEQVINGATKKAIEQVKKDSEAYEKSNKAEKQAMFVLWIKGYSVAQIARWFHRSPATVGRWLRG